jgi:hypothetical protein
MARRSALADDATAQRTNRAMNNTENPNSSQPSGETQPDGTNRESGSQPNRCAFEPLCSAVNDGAHRARAAAEHAIPKVKAAITGATYWLGYGVSFASVFTYTVAKELAPESLKAGCRDGASAGKNRAHKMATNTETGTASQEAGSSGPLGQPSLA